MTLAYSVAMALELAAMTIAVLKHKKETAYFIAMLILFSFLLIFMGD